MRLTGLKDEQGRDVELVISDEGHPHHHVLRVEVVDEPMCANCKYYAEAILDNPCDACIDGIGYPCFVLSTPTKEQNDNDKFMMSL